MGEVESVLKATRYSGHSFTPFRSALLQARSFCSVPTLASAPLQRNCVGTATHLPSGLMQKHHPLIIMAQDFTRMFLDG